METNIDTLNLQTNEGILTDDVTLEYLQQNYYDINTLNQQGYMNYATGSSVFIPYSNISAISNSITSLSSLTVTGNTTTLSSFNVAGTTLLQGNTTTLSSFNVMGQTLLQGSVTSASSLNVLGQTNLMGNLFVTGVTILLSGGMISAGTFNVNSNSILRGTVNINSDLNVSGITNLKQTNIGNIINIESVINNKVDNITLASYLKTTDATTTYLSKTEAADTYLTITGGSNISTGSIVNPNLSGAVNINGYMLEKLNFNRLNITAGTILGNQWVNGVVGVGLTGNILLRLPSAFEIYNTTLSKLGGIGNSFHTWITCESSYGKGITLIANNTSSITTLYPSYGSLTSVTTGSILLNYGQSSINTTQYRYEFITRLDSMTTMSIFRVQ
jgi:hypothetical protein